MISGIDKCYEENKSRAQRKRVALLPFSAALGWVRCTWQAQETQCTSNPLNGPWHLMLDLSGITPFMPKGFLAKAAPWWQAHRAEKTISLNCRLHNNSAYFFEDVELIRRYQLSLKIVCKKYIIRQTRCRVSMVGCNKCVTWIRKWSQWERRKVGCICLCCCSHSDQTRRPDLETPWADKTSLVLEAKFDLAYFARRVRLTWPRYFLLRPLKIISKT